MNTLWIVKWMLDALAKLLYIRGKLAKRAASPVPLVIQIQLPPRLEPRGKKVSERVARRVLTSILELKDAVNLPTMMEHEQRGDIERFRGHMSEVHALLCELTAYISIHWSELRSHARSMRTQTAVFENHQCGFMAHETPLEFRLEHQSKAVTAALEFERVANELEQQVCRSVGK